MNEIMLSVYMTTYNHEKYISQAIDSVLEQKTDYKYEIIIGDDVSQDRTREILREYEKNHPEIIKVFYRTQNMYKKAPDNGDDLRSRCKGKYVIALEGDDFWIDKYKLQKQIDFLESHNEYIGVAHNCLVVDDNGLPYPGYSYPECKWDEYSIRMLLKGILPGQLTTVMYRNYLYNSSVDTSLLGKGLMPTDKLIYFILSSYGKIYCIQEKMSAYRFVYNTGSSFTANYEYVFEDEENWSRELLEYSYRIRNKESIRCAEIIYFRTILKGLKKKRIGYLKFLKLLLINTKNVFLVLINCLNNKMDLG